MGIMNVFIERAIVLIVSCETSDTKDRIDEKLDERCSSISRLHNLVYHRLHIQQLFLANNFNKNGVRSSFKYLYEHTDDNDVKTCFDKQLPIRENMKRALHDSIIRKTC